MGSRKLSRKPDITGNGMINIYQYKMRYTNRWKYLCVNVKYKNCYLVVSCNSLPTGIVQLLSDYGLYYRDLDVFNINNYELINTFENKSEMSLYFAEYLI